MINLSEIFSTLSQKEECVIRLYFGFGIDGSDMGTSDCIEIGKRFDITTERARQILNRALRKLRHPLRVRWIKKECQNNLDAVIFEKTHIRIALPSGPPKQTKLTECAACDGTGKYIIDPTRRRSTPKCEVRECKNRAMKGSFYCYEHNQTALPWRRFGMKKRFCECCGGTGRIIEP